MIAATHHALLFYILNPDNQARYGHGRQARAWQICSDGLTQTFPPTVAAHVGLPSAANSFCFTGTLPKRGICSITPITQSQSIHHAKKTRAQIYTKSKHSSCKEDTCTNIHKFKHSSCKEDTCTNIHKHIIPPLHTTSPSWIAEGHLCKTDTTNIHVFTYTNAHTHTHYPSHTYASMHEQDDTHTRTHYLGQQRPSRANH